MDVFRHKKTLLLLGLFFVLTFYNSADGLILPPDPLPESLRMSVYSPPPPQGGVLIWGPITFLRDREKPKTEQISIPISDPTGPFLLRLTNGTFEGRQRISSAVIKLNSQEVFRPSEFSQQVGELSRQVTLVSGENLLEARLRSAPGTFITFELFRLERYACSVYGLHTFTRSKGKPVVETKSFKLSPQFSGPFTLHLTNGNPDGSKRVDSAIITLNGVSVFHPNDFNEQVGSISQVVSLQSTNTLNVELQGAPGDFLTIGIIGYDNTPPYVAITSPSDGAIFRSGPIEVRGEVDDPSASVKVNGIVVPVASDGSFTLAGVVLEEGENQIKVNAIDACGNQGEDEIAVYLRAITEGPLLTFCIERFMPTIAMAGITGVECLFQEYSWGWGMVSGFTDETAVSLTINGILFPDEEEVREQGNIDYGIREGNSFWAWLRIPEEGVNSFTAVATNAEGVRSEATVIFIRDTVPPAITITSPSDGWVTSNPNITVTGTVDDPQATVRWGWAEPPIPVINGTFTTQVVLSKEGLNNIFITAVDPIWNFSYAEVMITLDTIPPQINLTSPTEGLAVNSLTLNVTGTVTDETIETVTVAVNDGSPQALTLTGTNFSGAVALVSGLNTLTLTATDKAGNTSRVSRSVLLDIGPPVIAITSPVSGANVSGTISVTVEAADAISGIAGVTLLVDGHPAGAMSQAPFNFSLNTSTLTPGSHTITARAIDRAGNQGEASITVSVSQFRIEIISPANGATISKSQVLVQGKVYNQTGEIGVVVNGVLAEVAGSDFAAIIPLQLGQNVLMATATIPDGFQVQTSVTINTGTQQEMIRLTVSPMSGILDQIGILNVTFEAEAYLSNPVSSYSWDFNGDGTPEITGVESKITAQYQEPGLYFPKLTITDTQGNVYTETIVVNVLSLQELDALLRSKWGGMKNKLLSGDVEGALVFFEESAKPAYRELFNTLSSLLPVIVQEMSDVQLNAYASNAVIYDIRTIREGIEYSFQLLFTQDSGGIWRISSF